MKATFLSLLLAIVCCALPAGANAQTLLRWKLKPGETLNLNVQQETESQVAFSGKAATTKIDLSMELTWLVTAADDKEIKLKQAIQAIQLKLQSPQGGLVEYDSAAVARPAGQAREIADSLKPLIGAEINITMTPRGEIVAAEPANDAAEQLLKVEGKADEPPAVSRAAVQQLLRQSLVVLPEKPVALNDEWTHTSQLSGAAGDFQQVTKYRLASVSDVGGQPVALLEMSAKLDAAPPAATLPAGKRPAPGKLKLKEHTQTGTIQFALDSGRVTSAEQTQKLITERPYRETTIVVTLSSKQTTAVRSTQ